MKATNVSDLVAGVLAGNKRMIARAISHVENKSEVSQDIITALFPHCGKAQVIGITGPPGAGKSTLVGSLVAELRRQDRSCGLILVDPSSPFTGGALLGDRIRMPHLATDPGVYIRSMGTRGSLGGLATATRDTVKVLDAAGYDTIIIETVGIGQAETDIVKTSDAVIVVSVPGLGDHIQTLKAGVMEIADIFVVNKSDLPGAKRTIREIRAMLEMSSYAVEERPQVVPVTATDGEGIPELIDSIGAFLARQQQSGAYQTRRRDQIETELRNILHYELSKQIDSRMAGDFLSEQISRILVRQTNPYHIAEKILGTLLSKGESQMLQKIDHLGVAVKSIEETLKFYRDAMGIEPTAMEEVPSQKVKVAFLPVGESNIELLEPTSEDSAIAKHLAKRGEGIAHLAFRVENVEEAMADLKAKGVRLLSDTPLPGAHGAKIVFIHPKSAHGILIELCERHD